MGKKAPSLAEIVRQAAAARAGRKQKVSQKQLKKSASKMLAKGKGKKSPSQKTLSKIPTTLKKSR